MHLEYIDNSGVSKCIYCVPIYLSWLGGVGKHCSAMRIKMKKIIFEQSVTFYFLFLYVQYAWHAVLSKQNNKRKVLEMKTDFF